LSPEQLLATCGLYLGTFVIAAISSVVPIVAIDVFLVAVAVMSPGAALPLIVALAALGQLAGKLPIYGASRVVVGDRLRAWIVRWERMPHLVLVFGTVIGPFSLVATAAAVLGVRVRAFSAIVLGGRALRFAALVMIARLWV
jgi:hypothetical protein